MDYQLTRLLRQGVPLLTALAICLLVLAISAILYLGREVFVPLALAILLSFVLAPAVRLLQRARLPHGLAVIGVVLAAFAAIALLGMVVASQVSGLAADLPTYRTTITEKITRLRGDPATPSTFSRALDALAGIARDLQGGGPNHPASGRGPGRPAEPSQPPVSVVVQDQASMLSVAGGVLSPLLHPLATTGIVLIFAVFVLAQREDLRNRLIRLVGTDDLQHTTAVIDDAARRLSRFFLMQLALNAGFGLVIGLGLWAVGVPSPILWGILAGILRFIPYVGAAIGALFPLALALAVDPGWSMLLWTAALFIVVEPLIGHVLEPVLYGHSTGLSPVAVVLSATVWAFLWGPIGLVLATPLTVCLVVLGRHVGQLEFLDVMLGDRPALSPAEIFYQRMLAGDPAEAVLQAREFLRERALATYYDEIALEGVRLAQSDIARGRIAPDRQEVLRRSIRALVDELDALGDPRPRGGAVGAEAAAAVVAAGPDRAATAILVDRAKLRPDWRSECPVLCIAARDTLDEVTASMCAQVLTKHGLTTRVVATEDLDHLPPEAVAGIRLVCLSFIEPLSTLHLRYAVRSTRRRFAGVTTLLGIWRQRDPEMGLTLRQAARADVLVTTVYGTLAAALEAAGFGTLNPARSQPVLARAAE